MFGSTCCKHSLLNLSPLKKKLPTFAKAIITTHSFSDGLAKEQKIDHQECKAEKQTMEFATLDLLFGLLNRSV